MCKINLNRTEIEFTETALAGFFLFFIIIQKYSKIGLYIF